MTGRPGETLVATAADVAALLDVTDGRGEAALVDAARRLRDRSPEQVAEQLRRRRAVEAKA